jgi:hypothetical protein
MRYSLFALLFGLSIFGCNKLNIPNSNLDYHPLGLCDGCDFTRNMSDRTIDSIIVNISLDSTIQTFAGNYLNVSLLEYNPNICDVPACLVQCIKLTTYHNYGDTSLCSIQFKYSRSNSLYYYFYASLNNGTTNNKIMCSGPYACIFHTHLDTGNIKLITIVN